MEATKYFKFYLFTHIRDSGNHHNLISILRNLYLGITYIYFLFSVIFYLLQLFIRICYIHFLIRIDMIFFHVFKIR